MTAVQEYVETNTTDKDDEAAHIVLVPEHLKGTTTPQAYVLNARVEGTLIVALCGYEWVPRRDPEPLPVCSKCLEIYENDPNGFGDRDELPNA